MEKTKDIKPVVFHENMACTCKDAVAMKAVSTINTTTNNAQKTIESFIFLQF